MKRQHIFPVVIPITLLFLCSIACSKRIADLTIQSASTIEINPAQDSEAAIIQKAAHVVPTANQYAALQDEFIAFIHFGPNAFTRMEWGNGMEDPKIFNLKTLDTDQWCRAMKAAGMTKVIITVKHHDGFCLWQSRYTEHGIMSSPFKEGKGDILKELAASCQKMGLKLGVYLSPADLYQIESKTGLYGNLSTYTERVIPRPVEGRPFKNKTTFKFKVDDYNEYFLNQLFELLTEYGPIHEVWFDGAHPKRKGGQTYNYLAWKELISALAPEAVIFGKQDIRWCGNEAGRTRDTEWNIIPYKEDPALLNRFDDLTAASLGSREDLLKGKFLHYQPAETNTSIREGWFYRDDTDQKVRSADDVFDIYERSVGGNSTFLLNIPPNREGKFSSQDVQVLEEVGKRIMDTYSESLLTDAKGPKEVLDSDPNSYVLLTDKNNEILITTSSPVTLNRFLIQEAIQTHSERIEAHALDAWIDNDWKEIARASNVGYKRILRFPEVRTNKLRLRVLASRLQPAISHISAHYYQTRPAQLSITRSLEGNLSIQPKKHAFGWNPHGEDAIANINRDMEIRYTLDGSEPSKQSNLYTKPFFVASGEVKAQAYNKEEKGSVASTVFGIIKKDWKLIGVDSETENQAGAKAFDANPATYWQTSENGKKGHFLALDLGKIHEIRGFVYTPQTQHSEGMIEKGSIFISEDGKSWQELEDFSFGNLINDPSPRKHYFKSAQRLRFVKIESRVIAGGTQSATIAELDFLN